MNLYKKMNWKTILFLGKWYSMSWGYLLHFTRNLSERIKKVIIKLVKFTSSLLAKALENETKKI